jgi:hypothetical protein
MSTIATATETDARRIFDLSQATSASTIAEFVDATGLDAKYVRSLLVTMDKRGLLLFQPDQAEQVQGYHWDEDLDGIFESLWNDGEPEVVTVTQAVQVTGTCRCGCGEAVAGKRIYRPGHDARHASQVAKALIAGASDEAYDALPTAALRLKAAGQVARAAKKAEVKAARARATGKRSGGSVNAKHGTTTSEMGKIVEGTVKIGRWTYPARTLGDKSVVRNTKRDGSGDWVSAPSALFDAN